LRGRPMSAGFRARPPQFRPSLGDILETALDKRAERPDPTPSAAPPVRSPVAADLPGHFTPPVVACCDALS
jgi:hypothetical protein